jgi:DNA-directed RNA polymerase specialized sigma subunit
MLNIADRSTELLDDDIQLPNLEEELSLFEDFEPEPAQIGFYSDGHIQIEEAVFEIDEYCEKFLKILIKKPAGISIHELHEELFGGYKGYSRPTDAQIERLNATIAYLAGIELEAQTTLFTAYTQEGEPDNTYFQPNFTHKYFRKPYVQQPNIIEAPEQPTASKLDLLGVVEREIAHAVANPSNYVGNYEDRVYRKTLYKVIVGTERPTFDQEVAINKAITNFNEWLSGYGVNFHLRSFVTQAGPAIRLEGLADGLLEDIEATEERILDEFEREMTQNEIEREIKSQDSAIPKPHTRLAVPVQKHVEQRSLHPIARAFNLPAVITPSDYLLVGKMAYDLRIEESEVLGARILLGKALSNNILPTGKEQIKIIRFLQASRTYGEAQKKRDRELNLWTDAAFGVMVMSYERRLVAMAGHLAGGHQDRFDELKNAGMWGLEDGLRKYTEDRGNPLNYLPRRIYGEMVDHVRRVAWGGRSEAQRVEIVSLDAPASSEDSGGSKDLLLSDTLAIEDQDAQAAFTDVDNTSVTVKVIASCIERLKAQQVQPNSKLERDIKITILYFGVEALMDEQDLALYRSIPHESHGANDVSLLQLGLIFDLEESRISQIVGNITEKLSKMLVAEKSDLLV